MKKNTILFCLFLILIVKEDAFPQSNEQLPQLAYKGQTFAKYLMKNIKFPQGLSCGQGIALAAIRFKIDSSGNLAFLEVSGGIGDTAKVRIKEIMLRTNGYWKSYSNNGKNVGSNLIIQPIVYKIVDDCANSSQHLLYDYIEQAIKEIFYVKPEGETCTILNPFVVTGRIKGLP